MMLDEVMDTKLEEKKTYPELKHDAMYSEEYEGAVVMREFDEAFIGYGTHFTPKGQKPIAVYDQEKIISMLQEEFEQSAKDSFPVEDLSDRDFYLEAQEYFYFNIVGGYAASDGACMPVFVVQNVQSWAGFTD
jgi:hypothetical protein